MWLKSWCIIPVLPVLFEFSLFPAAVWSLQEQKTVERKKSDQDPYQSDIVPNPQSPSFSYCDLLLFSSLCCPLCYPLPSFPIPFHPPISAHAASFIEEQAAIAVIKAASEPHYMVGRGAVSSDCATDCSLWPATLRSGSWEHGNLHVVEMKDWYLISGEAMVMMDACLIGFLFHSW